MKKEGTKVGDIEIHSQTGKPEICVDCLYWKEGYSPHWEDFETHLLHTRMGMFPGSNMVHTLQYFVDVLNTNKSQSKQEIKIRYAYIASPTNANDDPAYYETTEFKVLTIEQLETRSIKTTFEELITDNETVLIRILGRDRYTGRKDFHKNEIYENDIIRWFTGDDEHIFVDERVGTAVHYGELKSERDCMVIGNVYTLRVGIM